MHLQTNIILKSRFRNWTKDTKDFKNLTNKTITNWSKNTGLMIEKFNAFIF